MYLHEYISEKFGLSERETAGYILAGKVLVNDEVCSWLKYKIKTNDNVRIKYKKTDFVTRSGYKLNKALEVFSLDPSEMTALDIGASEGGFTDCLLKHGVHKVYAVDVAYGILNYELRINPQVVVLERKNARYLTEDDITECVDLITTDVSFISLIKIIPVNMKFLKENGKVIMLFKPQFELLPEDLGKNGMPISKVKVIDKIFELVTNMRKENLFVCKIAKSPIKGNSGNVEYLLLGQKTNGELLSRCDIEACVLDD